MEELGLWPGSSFASIKFISGVNDFDLTERARLSPASTARNNNHPKPNQPIPEKTSSNPQNNSSLDGCTVPLQRQLTRGFALV
jgi:hypothetical protein